MTADGIDIRRLSSALLVVFIHVVIIAVLLHAVTRRGERITPAREIVLRFLRPPPPAIVKPVAPPPPIRSIVPLAPSPHAITPPPAANPGSLQGLHMLLFNCAPENLGNLSPEERQQCEMASIPPAPAQTDIPRNLPSRAKDAPQWERALARKNNPTLLPCMPPLSLAAVLCMGNGLANGFGKLDNQPHYGDAPGVAARVPNNGDPSDLPLHH